MNKSFERGGEPEMSEKIDRRDVELAYELRNLFEDNRRLFEELVVRGWTVELKLPADGMMLAFGFSPTGLADGAGFVVTRVVSPEYLHRVIEKGTTQLRGKTR